MTGPARSACAYCGRKMWLAGLEPCCDKPEHTGRLVCADVRGCIDVVIVRLHDQPVADQLRTGDQDRQLAAIRLVLDSFDWPSARVFGTGEDALFALEQILDVLDGSDR